MSGLCSVFCVPWHGVIVWSWWLMVAPRPHPEYCSSCLWSVSGVWVWSVMRTKPYLATPLSPAPVTSSNDPGIGFSVPAQPGVSSELRSKIETVTQLISNRWVILREECNYKNLMLNLLAINKSHFTMPWLYFPIRNLRCDSWCACENVLGWVGPLI